MKKLLVLLALVAVALSACGEAPTQAPRPGPTDPSPTLETSPSGAQVATATLQLPTLVTTATRAATVKPTPTIQVKAADLRGSHIVFWYPASSDLEKAYNTQVADFNSSNVWGITVEGRRFPSGTQLEDQLQANQKSGAMPQAVAAPVEFINSWAGQDNLVTSLDSYLQDPEWGLTAQETADFARAFWQIGQVSGKRWSLPLMGDVQVLYYNQSWAEELGFHLAPLTPADFRTQACAAMKANVADGQPDNDGTGGWIISKDALSLEAWRRAFGAGSLPDQEGQKYTFNTAPSVQAFSFLRKLLDDNCAWNAKNPTPYVYFAQRQALFYSGTLLDLAFQERAMTFQKSSDRWAVLAYPSQGPSPVAMASGTGLAVIRSDKAVESLAAWLFLRYLILPRNQASLAKAEGLLPARTSALAEMSDYRAAHPQWALAATWLDRLQPEPWLASWRTVRRVEEDAAWQILSPIIRVDGIPAVLEELDATVTDLLKK
jgi:multiple sugar transport system substrate-binding protein